MKDKQEPDRFFEWFFAEGKYGDPMYGIRCSHGFVKYTTSRKAAESCVKSWNKKQERLEKDYLEIDLTCLR